MSTDRHLDGAVDDHVVAVTRLALGDHDRARIHPDRLNPVREPRHGCRAQRFEDGIGQESQDDLVRRWRHIASQSPEAQARQSHGRAVKPPIIVNAASMPAASTSTATSSVPERHHHHLETLDDTEDTGHGRRRARCAGCRRTW